VPIPVSKPVEYVTTYNKDKGSNGWLHLLVNEHNEEELPIEQVYLTYCSPGEVKGPHVHRGKKCDRFYCIQGSAVLVCRDEETQQIYEFHMEACDGFVIYIPADVSHGIVSKDGATLVSMPTEGFRKDKEYNQEETTYEGYNWNRWL